MEYDAMLMDDADGSYEDEAAEAMGHPNGIPFDVAVRLLDGFERLCREQAILAQPFRHTPPGMLDEIALLLHDSHDTLLALLTGAPLTLPPSILLHKPDSPE